MSKINMSNKWVMKKTNPAAHHPLSIKEDLFCMIKIDLKLFIKILEIIVNKEIETNRP